jgi:hypothetical protein
LGTQFSQACETAAWSALRPNDRVHVNCDFLPCGDAFSVVRHSASADPFRDIQGRVVAMLPKDRDGDRLKFPVG